MTLGTRSWVEQVMGLPVSLLARGEVENVDVAAFYDELRWVDAVFSPYREESEVSRIVAGALTLADAHPLVRHVAARCEEERERTGGLFDATDPQGRWDPSGFVKGWAVERASRRLLREGLDWCVNAGGDVVVRCPSGEPFRVGVEDPRDRSRLVAVVPLASGGLATSGTAARGDHLYDPRTGTPARGLASLTVVAPTLELADVLATAAFVDGGLRLVVEAGCEGLAVRADGARATTPNFPRA